tara:strand:+ start:7756 stop:8406 length:651 start_codon:yes stop_codon:yes gene_type:complete
MEPDPIEISTEGSSLVATTSPLPEVGGFDIFAYLGSLFGNSETFASLTTGSGFMSFLASLWLTVAIISSIFSIFFLVIYVFASMRRTLYLGLLAQETVDQEELWAQLYGQRSENNRIKSVLANAASSNPNDWKLAIIEADIILDETLKERGFVGDSLGERLKSVSANQLASIGDAWEAHKVRNNIAHKGADFVLTKRLVDETIGRYQRVFKEFGLM